MSVFRVFATVALALLPGVGWGAGAHTVRVSDAQGRPLPGVAVVAAAGIDAGDGETAGGDGQTQVVMDQRNRRFVPELLVVQRGSMVRFPNNDTVMHHVYSFSDPKIFEIPLYQGNLPSPVRFDRSGLVVIGCNIHDQMIGHILVVNTSIFGVTDQAGTVTFEHPPDEVVVWRPGMRGIGERRVRLSDAGSTDIRLARQSNGTGGALSWDEY